MDIKLFIATPTVVAISALFNLATAAELTDAHKLDQQKGLSKLVQQDQKMFPKKAIGDEDFRQTKRETDKRGNVHGRYQQHLGGIPVWGGEVTVHKTGDKTVVTGKLASGLDSATLRQLGSGKISKSEAVTIARAKALAAASTSGEKLAAQEELADKFLLLDKGAEPRVVYHVLISVNRAADMAPISATHSLVDASTGEIVRSWSGFHEAKIGTGPGGNEKTGLKEYGTGLDFMDVTQSGTQCTLNTSKYYTVDTNGGSASAGQSAFAFTCPRNTQRSYLGSYSSQNDAHWAAGKTYEMFNSWLGTDPMPLKVKLFTYLGFPSSWSENAVYAGNHNGEIWIVFGQGASQRYAMTSLDVVAHEIGHGLTDNTSHLLDSSDSQGIAINEAFSDMTGQAVQQYTRGSNDWQVAAETSRPGVPPLRYMDHPGMLGDPESVSQYNPDQDPHASAGIYNRSFYLLATTAGWTTRKAYEVFAQANRYYWTINTNFVTGACDLLHAANDLQYSVADVDSALTSVGAVCQNKPVYPVFSASGTVYSMINGAIGSRLESATIKFSGSRGVFTTISDSNGQFNYNTLPTGNYTVTAVKAGYTFAADAAGPVNVTSSNVVGLLVPGNASATTVWGIVLDAATGNQVGGVNVTALSSSNAVLANDETDQSGRFEFATLPAGSYKVQLNDGGWSGSANVTVTSTPVRANITAAVLAGSTAISGTVKDSTGAAVRGAAITVTACTKPASIYSVTTTSSGFFKQAVSQTAAAAVGWKAGAVTCPAGSAIVDFSGDMTGYTTVSPTASYVVPLGSAFTGANFTLNK